VASVIVGVLRLTLLIPESGSLKGKRRVLRSLKDRLRSQFNVSVAETGSHDLWQRAEVGVALVSRDREYAARVLQKILNRIDSWRLVEVIDVEMEIL
jgi:uncharacterized protein YlxP (DUF503 family)